MAELENKTVFDILNNGINKALREALGDAKEKKYPKVPAQIAVALLQLSLRYFAVTGAPKAVVFDFFLGLMGVQGERATLEEDEHGYLKIKPPTPPLIAVPKLVK